jgi:DNA-directed RNA polymerase specialized sigma24 family protein
MNIVSGQLVGVFQKGALLFVESFEAWYEREHDRMIATLLLTTGDMELAVEGVDEACSRALERWSRVSTMESPSGWVYRVALNQASRLARRQNLEKRLFRKLVPKPDLPGPAGEIWELVESLPRRQRQVVMLRYVADLPEAEIAAVLEISRGTVSSTLRDARVRLGRLLKDDVEPTEVTHD